MAPFTKQSNQYSSSASLATRPHPNQSTRSHGTFGAFEQNKQASPKLHPPIASSINNSSAHQLPANKPSLPSLSNTDTNTNIPHSNTNHSNIPPPTPIPSNTLSNRKQNANQMINQVEFINESLQRKIRTNNNRKLQTAVQKYLSSPLTCYSNNKSNENNTKKITLSLASTKTIKENNTEAIVKIIKNDEHFTLESNIEVYDILTQNSISFAWDESINMCFIISDIDGNIIYYAPQINNECILHDCAWISIGGIEPIPQISFNLNTKLLNNKICNESSAMINLQNDNINNLQLLPRSSIILGEKIENIWHLYVDALCICNAILWYIFIMFRRCTQKMLTCVFRYRIISDIYSSMFLDMDSSILEFERQ